MYDVEYWEDEYNVLLDVKQEFLSFAKYLQRRKDIILDDDINDFIINTEQALDDLLLPRLNELREKLGNGLDLPISQPYASWLKSKRQA